MHLSEDTLARLITLLESLNDYQEAEERLLRRAARGPRPDSPVAQHQHRKATLALQKIQSDRALTSALQQSMVNLVRQPAARPEQPAPAAHWNQLPLDFSLF